jgi:glycosyltransferase involved in cell wall biosynthesis
MRVLCPHCGVRADTNSGGEAYERMLLEALPANGIELELGILSSRPVEQPPPGWHVTMLRPGTGIRWWLAPVPFLPFAYRTLRRLDVDLLRAHSVRFTAPTLLAARALARVRVPLVVHHLHSERSWARFEKLILRRADAIVTISRHSRAQLIAAGIPPERIAVIPPGVRAPHHIGSTFDWPRSDSYRVAYLGRFEERKRPHIPIEALAHLVRRGVDCSLVMAGAGPMRSRLERRAGELGVADRICWTGMIDDDEKWRLLAAADVVVFPSRLEGFGLVAAEAHAVGTPVVAAAGTATSEIVIDGATGFLVNGGAREFADALERLEDPAVRDAMAPHARDAARRFSPEVAAAEVAAVYRAVVAREALPVTSWAGTDRSAATGSAA